MLKKTILIIVIGVIAVTLWPKKEGKSCVQTTDEEVTSIVKKDFSDRIPHWKDDARFLGTLKPTLIWGKTIRDDNTVTVPFIAKGENNSKDYFGIYTCKKDNVEYSVK